MSADEIDRWAAAVPPGADGLIILPFLTGERSPYWNAAARGVVFGLSLAHHRGHLVRAMLEGIGYRMRSILDALTEVAGPVSEVRAAGGFVGSPVWMQIVADVLDQPLHLPVTQEASALGAAMLAMRATGHVERFAELLRFVHVEGACHPQPANVETYRRLYDLYMRLYWRLQDDFREIADFQAAAIAS